ncbi:HslU--HslV peptidase ATPase subunit [Helicobacter sp. MIT 05-5293]|uniref:ATP-dependent protease ATPase subunit HslU n=1 Tax=uncultured Helicobacter sp. TaxID=175537 RepID=A0A650EJT6_9HELI|nr:ATP-dependent protease ATPase subunit HslU [uncultured Helicobacter sp.]TLD81780.1 HslU--HslV peptidase ATPase subunit [Helicobacter sp. MIT 05-5293]
MKENMTPKQIVEYLDNYIIGQKEAKKAVAIALRNRYRRMKLDKEVQEEITPKNILMIGSTGVGKTEIARRMAKMMGLPFVKVEASKYTEVGFVGRDVESMVRDLVLASVNLVESEHRQKAQAQINDYILEKITQKLLPPLPSGVSEAKKNEYEMSFAKMKQKVIKGEVDDLMIELEVSKKPSVNLNDDHLTPDMIKVQESIFKVLNVTNDKIKKEISVKEAKEALMYEATESVLDAESIRSEGLRRAQENGVIFIDEIDKVAVGSKDSSRQDPSKEGVQRDLLPIVEGSVVNTKYGQIKTDYILFIAAGAFHFSKPSDLIPELQGRFPLRVELSTLDEQSLYEILTQTKSSLLRQYQLLMLTEEIKLDFDDDAVRELARLSHNANQRTEDIGARRLHTTIERVLEDVSFDVDRYKGKEVVITAQMVRDCLGDLVENVDLARYIL